MKSGCDRGDYFKLLHALVEVLRWLKKSCKAKTKQV